MSDILKLIDGAVKLNASDIHLMEDAKPRFRINEDLLPINHPPVNHEQMMEFLKLAVPERLQIKLERSRGIDAGYQYKDLVRVRLTAFYERRRLSIIMRLIPPNPPTVEELELPPILNSFVEYKLGLVLVTGPAGCGKTTTLAALIERINSTRNYSITTIEDPVEYVHANKKCMVTQREVGDDVEDFNTGLIQAMRQDPDVILVGEIREVETARAALQASETGHLVLSTLHTSRAVESIERILNMYPDAERDSAREQLATNLRAVISQDLVKRAEAKGRIAVLEIMIVTKHMAQLLHENRIDELEDVIRSGEMGMQIFDHALADLVRTGKVPESEGERFAHDVFAFRREVKGIASTGDRGGIIGAGDHGGGHIPTTNF